MGDRNLVLGRQLGGEGDLALDMDHLTTHAVCLGMTGSGKTGLGIVALEELARRRIPLLVVDLKGDMLNLLLNFPELDAESFRPWLPADTLGDGDPAEAAREQAEMWRTGLQRSGLGPSEMRAVRDGIDWQLLTPGVASLAPVDILPTLSAPDGWEVDLDPDLATDRVNGVAGAILSLVGRGGDPLADRDHVLTASVILEHWRRGETLDFGRLLASLADPPMEVLGALPLDVFYPRDERMKLVMALNTLLASPAFRSWTTGVPLTMESLLGSRENPRGSIISVAHLDETQRLFVISLLVSEIVAWMRRQPASSGIRALLYMDEVFGILPPHPANPPTKGPLLTLFKQGRAFGVGAWLATQNPVDLDYKALGNAGVKLVGRLITDRDRERALEGLGLDILPDGRDAGDAVAALGKREFLVDDVRSKPRVRLFSSRWAMSYLRGPVTLAEMPGLVEPRAASTEEVVSRGHSAATGDRSTPPVLDEPCTVRFDPTVSGLAEPSMMIRSRLLVTRKGLDLHRELEELWRVPVAGSGELDWDNAEPVEAEPSLATEPSEAMRFPAAAPARLGGELKRAEKDFIRWRARRGVDVVANAELDLVAAPEESRDAFLERCYQVADRSDDASQERIRSRFEKRMNTVRKRLGRERDELERDRTTLSSRRAEEKLGLVEGLFSVLLGSRSARSASRKAASKIRTAAGKRRMRQTAEGSVTESLNEIARLEEDLEQLAEDLQDEVDAVAEASERKAEQIDSINVRPVQRDIEVRDLVLVWS
jgi:DNA helicase HerA-like ATPase